MSGKKQKPAEPTGLKKIDSLLSAMGISEEARKEFITVCEGWHASEKEKIQEEFQSRLEKAKKVCVEETEAHKASLSRGVQIFLENEADKIRKASEKNAAIAEPEAVNQLKQIQAVLGGIDIDGAVNAQALQAESKKNALLVKQVAELTESVTREKAKSAKSFELAEKAISRQKGLENEISEMKSVLSEARERMQKKEAKPKPKPISEHKVKKQQPKTKTKLVSESDVGKGKPKGESSDIDVIAEQMD